MREEDTRPQETSKEKRNKRDLETKCRKARNNWMEDKCNEVESLFKIEKVGAAHRKITENFMERRINANIVRDENGKALMKLKKKLRE